MVVLCTVHHFCPALPPDPDVFFFWPAGLLLFPWALALLEGLCRLRRRGAGPGLPLQYVKDIRAGDAQCKASILLPVIKLVGVRTAERLDTPQRV